MIERFLTQTSFTSTEDYNKNLHFKIPENFNFAYDVMDAWATEAPEKTAIIWTNDEGEEMTLEEVRRLNLITDRISETSHAPIHVRFTGSLGLKHFSGTGVRFELSASTSWKYNIEPLGDEAKAFGINIDILIQFEQDYPGKTTKDNVDGIAESLQEKTNRASVLAKLRQLQAQADQSDQPQRKNHYDLER